MLDNKEYKQFIEERGITRLCHFTKIKNLPYILGKYDGIDNGILATEYIDDRVCEVNDQHRLDGRRDYVCTSIEYPNLKFFYVSQKNSKDSNFRDWVVLLINPEIIGNTALFSKYNAALERGKYIKKGISSFRELFDNFDVRPMLLPDNITTNDQAEVLISQKIPVEAIYGVVFKDKSVADAEKIRLKLCGVNTENLKFYICEEMFAGRDTRKKLETGEIIEVEEVEWH